MKKLMILLAILIASSHCKSKVDMRTEEKPVLIQRNGLQMVGMLHTPVENGSRHPAVMLLHGFTGNKSESHFLFTKLARQLAENGIICLRFDFLGSGDSQGEFEEMTIFTELEDAKVACQFLSQQPEVDANRIGVLGLSMGGCVAALLSRERADIKSVALLSAVARPEENFQRLVGNFPKTYRETGDWYIDHGGFAVGKNFFDSLPEVMPLKAISSYQGSVLIIHGSNDQAVPLSAAYDYHQSLNQRQSGAVELFIVDKADHVYSSIPLTTQVIDKVVDWFERTLSLDK